MSQKIMLLDANSLINRAFYGLPLLTAPGQPLVFTNAVYGFFNVFFKLLDEENPDYAACAFDVRAKTFRHKMYDGYKAHRSPTPPELPGQITLLKQLLTLMGVCIVEQEGFEADDILGTFAARASEAALKCVIVSGDKDMLQLASDTVCVRIPKTKGGKTITENYFAADFIEKMGITPAQYVDVKALMGDASDNIPGVRSIGEITALKIIREYGSIEAAIENADRIKPKKAGENLTAEAETARLSKILAQIRTDAPVEFTIEKMRLNGLYNDAAKQELLCLGLKQTAAQLSAREKAWDAVIEHSVSWQLEYPPMGHGTGKPVPYSSSNEAARTTEPYDDFVGDGIYEGCIHEQRQYAATSDAPQTGNIVPCDITNITTLSAFFSLITDGLLIGFSVYTNCGQTYIPIAADLTDVPPEISAYLASPAPKATLNAKDELLFYKKRGIDIQNIVFDASVALYIINPTKSTFNYDDIAFDFLNEDAPSLKQLQKESKPLGEKYALACARAVYLAHTPMKQRLTADAQDKLYYDMELPLAGVLADMELKGVRVDTAFLKDFGQKLRTRIDTLTSEIYTLSGEEFNINSTQQLGGVLFDKLKLPHQKKTKTGYSTQADVLEKLVYAHPIIEKILEYRSLNKLLSTYVEGLIPLINPETGRVHTTFNQTAVATGRLSSSNPNLQNIPVRLPLGRELRRAFIPEEGYMFVAADYSQIELRILAHLSGDLRLINAYASGADIHAITASEVFGTPLELVRERERNAAKAVNFGIIYGISAYGLGQDTGLTQKDAKRHIEAYFAAYPQIKAYLDGAVATVKERGYAETLFGRRRPIPGINAPSHTERAFAERVAKNSPIQGTAADIIKIAMLRVAAKLKEEGLKARIILQIHDELIIEAPLGEADETARLLKYEMENAAHLCVPLTVQVKTGTSWYDTK